LATGPLRWSSPARFTDGNPCTLTFAVIDAVTVHPYIIRIGFLKMTALAPRYFPYQRAQNAKELPWGLSVECVFAPAPEYNQPHG
jgi:hypothetical protein